MRQHSLWLLASASAENRRSSAGNDRFSHHSDDPPELGQIEFTQDAIFDCNKASLAEGFNYTTSVYGLYRVWRSAAAERINHLANDRFARNATVLQLQNERLKDAILSCARIRPGTDRVRFDRK